LGALLKRVLEPGDGWLQPLLQSEECNHQCISIDFAMDHLIIGRIYAQENSDREEPASFYIEKLASREEEIRVSIVIRKLAMHLIASLGKVSSNL
jgi:hypothetical protein